MSKIDSVTLAGAIQPPPVNVSRVFDAPRETVFRAWRSADHIKRWFSPAAYSVPEATIDLRVGGAFEVCMRSPEGVEHWTRGSLPWSSRPSGSSSTITSSIPAAAALCSAR